jgi:hypothetical protein
MQNESSWPDRLMFVVALFFIPTLWWAALGGMLLAILHFGLHAKVWTLSLGLVLLSGYGWLFLFWLVSLDRRQVVSALSSLPLRPAYHDLAEVRAREQRDWSRELGQWDWLRLQLWVVPVIASLGCGLVIGLLALLRAVALNAVEAWLWSAGLGLSVADLYLTRAFQDQRQSVSR